MGWLYDPSIRSRKEMVRYLTTPTGVWRAERPYTLLDHSVSGNEVYVLARHPDGHRFIAVFLIRSGREDGWGYKDMDESCGPNVVNCPERLLAQSDVEDTSGWRERCREARRGRNARQRALAELRTRVKPGDALALKDGRQLTYVGPCGFSNASFYCRLPGDSREYLAKWSQLATPDTPTDAASA